MKFLLCFPATGSFNEGSHRKFIEVDQVRLVIFYLWPEATGGVLYLAQKVAEVLYHALKEAGILYPALRKHVVAQYRPA